MANESMKSLMTLSSRSEGSTGLATKTLWRNAALHDRCTMVDMVKLKEAFQTAYRNKLMPTEFRNLLKTLLNVEYDDDEYKILFMKINTNRDGEIEWDELVSHLILGYFGNDAENQRESLQPPIMGLPTVMRSQHRHPISRVCFCPDVSKDRKTDAMQGMYITASRDGMINWWSLDMMLLRTAFSLSPHLKVRTTWVTDMVCMPDVNIIVTSSTERDLRFYDCTAKTFTLKIVISSWEYMISTMHYHFHQDVNEKCILICGDVGGNVRLLLFSPIKRGPFKNDAARALIQLRHIDLQRKTYIDIPPQVGERTPISAVYNRATREFILAAIKIAIIVLDEQLNPEHTDGFTHSRAVSKILYNPLFKVIITCGMDSIIINWNPVTGKRNAMVRDAHTRLLHGELIPVEITAACFDPGNQLLLTGARNGSLKVWNFNTGLCLRTMFIEDNCEVTNCFWVEGRILAVGWNRHVTEFEDTGTSTSGKSWETRHSDDVLAAASRPPLSLATASYNSELLLWKLETGQPYRRFSCTEPMLRIKMHYSKRDATKTAGGSAVSSAPDGRKSSLKHASMGGPRESISSSAAVKKAQARRVSTVSLPARIQNMRLLAVHACIFLTTRPLAMKVASLMLSLENGQVQAWSDHPAGGYQGSFQAIHTAGDYVSAFATDVDNDYLFTGTTIGYIKVWLMKNYLRDEKVHVNMPKLRLEFPFLWKDRIEGRAKRSVRDQPLPLLLNSYRGHLRCISSMAYIDELKLVFSGSSDYSVRVWRLSGEYLQTLGSFVPWSLEVTRFPPDVKKVASFTTFKVWRGGWVSRYVPGQVEVDKLRDITEMELRTKTFGAPPPEPSLGHYFALPPRPDRQEPVLLDDTLQTIPLYCHLRMASTTPVRRPPTPELVRETRLRRAATRKAHFDSTAPQPPQHRDQ